ncbi:hypothetical protein FM036_14545 [Nostoc sp. HG1]|nr:hypothetical protein [Nostoc sp. HG1]
MKKPLNKIFENFLLLSNDLGLEPELITWYASKSEIATMINEALHEYRTNHSLLYKYGWTYQIKIQYQLYVIDKFGIKYTCDVNFDKLTTLEQFIKTFLIHESGGEWITRNRLLFSKVSGEDCP